MMWQWLKTIIKGNNSGIVVTGHVTGDIIQNIDPAIIETLKQQLKLKDSIIITLQNVIEREQIPTDQQTAAFQQLAEKYAELQQRLNSYEHASDIEQQARQALEAGDLDKAEQLLEQANQQDQALLQQRLQDIAQRTFDLAEISELKYDLPRALERYQQVVNYQPDNLSAWRQIADISNMLGNTQNAIAAWQQLQQQAQTQGNIHIYKGALIGEADILAKHGYSQMALDKYQQAHQYFVFQAKQDPNNVKWQHYLYVSYERLGNIHKANGDGDKALNAYQDSLKIAKKPAKRDPNNSDWQRDLSVSFNKLGDMHQANGDGDKALNAYQDSLTIRDKLAKRDPNNSDWQRDLSVSFIKLGDMHQANGDGDKALNAYQDSLKIAEKLAKHDPNNSDWQYDLAISYERMGGIHKINNDSDKAINAYKNTLNITMKIAEKNPQNVQFQRELIVSYVKLSETITHDKKKYLQQALAIILQLEKTNRLYTEDKWIIDAIKKELNNS